MPSPGSSAARAAAENFVFEGFAPEVQPLGAGFVNDTFIVRTSARRYILQRKNRLIFADVPAMMANIAAVTEHIRRKVSDPLRETLTIVPAKDGKLYYLDGAGDYWAACLFIEDSISYETASNPELARQGGMGLGRFQALLADFDEPLAEVLPGFHDIRFRFGQWDRSLAADKAGRAGGLPEEIAFIEGRRAEMLDFWKLFEDGVLPSRVTHNDTKISNFLFDSRTGAMLCAVDLDTVMRSTPLNDVGDAVRSYANNAAEDEPDYSKVWLRTDMYEAYMQGYLGEMKDFLTGAEKERLAFAPLYITFEQVLRFLMDYIDGDTYYKTAYPEHNLVRARNQMALLRSMEDAYARMQDCVRDLLR